jgi:hypothetical protein
MTHEREVYFLSANKGLRNPRGLIQGFATDEYSGQDLYLFEEVHRDHKNGGTFFTRGSWCTRLAQDPDGGVHLVRLQADQQGGHAASQEASGGCNARDAEISACQSTGDGISVGVANYCKDQFHGYISS